MGGDEPNPGKPQPRNAQVDSREPAEQPEKRRLTLSATLIAAGVYAVVAVAFVGGGLLPEKTLSSSDLLWDFAPWSAVAPGTVSARGSNFEQSDAVLYFQPFLQQNAAVFPSVPLWNSHIAAGRPYLASPQTAVFSLFSLPAYVLPFWWSLAVIAAMKLFSAAMGTFLLGRAIGMRLGGGLLAGLAYGFGLTMVAWLPWAVGSVFALLPWLLLGVVLLLRDPNPIRAAALAVAVALVYLAGYPQGAALCLVVSAVLAAFLILSNNGTPRAKCGKAAVFTLTLVGGSAIAALTVVPFLDLLFRSYDYEFRSLFPGGHLPARYLLGVFLPDYWGRAPHTTLPLAENFLTDRAFYPGALTLMLAGAGIVLRPTRDRLLLALSGLVALGIVSGIAPLADIWSLVPLLGTAHVNHAVILFMLPLALLAGFGLDEMPAFDAGPARRTLVVLIASLLVVAPAVWMAVAGTLSWRGISPAFDLAWGSIIPQGAHVAGRRGPHIVQLAALLEWLLPAIAALGLLLLTLRRPLRPGLVLVATAVLLAADLWHVGLGINPWIPRAHAIQPVTGAIEYLQSRRPARFAGLNSGFNPALPPNLAMRYGLYDARGYDPPAERRFAEFWNETITPVLPSTPLAIPQQLSQRALRALSLLGVADVLQASTDSPLKLNGLRVAYRGSDARIYANDHALPRAFVVGRQQVMRPGAHAPAVLTEPTFDARRVVLTESRLPRLPRTDSKDLGKPGEARVLSYGDERVVVRAHALRVGLLVLNDAFDPGWKATVDGRDAEVHRVNYFMRGVLLSPGQHRIEFLYQPRSFRAGLILSLTSTAIFLAAAAYGLLRRRQARL